MSLSARPLKDVCSVNRYRTTDVWQMSVGDTAPLYLQLIDTTLDTSDEGFKPAYRRHAAAVGATLQITFESLDSARTIVRMATLPYPNQDSSIWRITLLPTDKIRGTVQMRLKLVEGSQTLYGTLQPAIAAADSGV